MIRQNGHIKGYKINGIEIKVSQYADDTIFLDGSEVAFEKCIETLGEFEKYSGLKMNQDKTKSPIGQRSFTQGCCPWFCKKAGEYLGERYCSFQELVPIFNTYGDHIQGINEDNWEISGTTISTSPNLVVMVAEMELPGEDIRAPTIVLDLLELEEFEV
ncbi:hypothetical protein PoB_005944500 [Plakobranchus ocellatus]|uniref:Reverse transcriptase domain-containing protein n=1 Tax=Plakobranchus ocellatus TaxID=259542 RepID=A0AAV4CM76_9GAST|nr:hypothetical protein PoB_005944500 [Plakobranchus ocellatus]